MTSWVWVPIGALHVIHDRQITRHGGTPGLRDTGLLEAGAARALNKAAYGHVDVFDLAAAYAYGVSKAHAFVDGNKRTGLVAALTFLRLNGFTYRPDAIVGLQMVEGLASGGVGEAAFAEWLRSGAKALED